MKKQICAALVLAMLLSLGTVAAAAPSPLLPTSPDPMTPEELYENATVDGKIGNEASFETFEQANLRGSAEQGLSLAGLECYPQGTTWVYRSADLYGSNSYNRLNTCFIVFADEHIGSGAEAGAVLSATGLTDIVDEARGSVILISPIGQQWGQQDFDAYQILQRALFDSQNNNYGAVGYVYMVGIHKGASFMNDFLAAVPDNIGRIAAVLEVGGSIEKGNAVGTVLPAYLYNTTDRVVSAFRAANSIDPQSTGPEYANAEYPAQRVVVDRRAAGTADREIIREGYDRLLKHLMRIPVDPGQNYWLDSDYWSLGESYTPEELHITEVAHNDGTYFKDTQIKRWYEYVPNECLDGTEGKAPLVVILHGNSDEPRAFLNHCGWLKKAGDERFFLVTIHHQDIADVNADTVYEPGSKVEQLDAVVAYMLERYPNIDPERVYLTGYSRGGVNTTMTGLFDSARFAAIAPMGGTLFAGAPFFGGRGAEVSDWDEAMARRGDCRIPTLLVMTGKDPLNTTTVGSLSKLNYMPGLDLLRMANGFEGVPADRLDYEKYPYWGFPTEDGYSKIVKDTYVHYGFLKDGGVPLMGFALADGMGHVLWQGYADIAWDYFSCFSRDLKTNDIVYTAPQS